MIADINMPKMNGLDLGAYLYEHCPVVLMSADEERVLQKRGDLKKCHGYFCKESKGLELIATARKAYKSWEFQNREKGL